jgi:hypothetical protein
MNSSPKLDNGRIDPELIHMRLTDQLQVIAGHLDLEGFAYVKVVRDGVQSCFAQDQTSELLKTLGFTVEDQKKLYWDKPAYAKWLEKGKS